MSLFPGVLFFRSVLFQKSAFFQKVGCFQKCVAVEKFRCAITGLRKGGLGLILGDLIVKIFVDYFHSVLREFDGESD